MALALYRKYRPRTFAEVIGQEHVTEPLSQALRTGRLHHAYLFSGPRGCGKTSSARILARSLNCAEGPTPEPCGKCDSCRALANDGAGSIDVIEIDAASHGGVDDARDLRERAFFAPVQSRYKIYVIDEAHMVSSAGFNALLKLVEEPPDFVKFIFATTEPEKVLGTIKSRTHHYPFRLIPPGVLRPYLEQLTAAEGIKVDPAVFPLVVRAGGGSVRDSLSVLDQLIAGAGPEGVSYARAVALLGVTDAGLIDEMCDALAAGDGAAAYATIDRVAEAGHDPRRFAADLLERLRDLIILRQVPDAVAKGLIDGPADQIERMTAQAERFGPATLSRFADILHNGLVEMRGTTAPRLLLELICARMLLPAADDSTGALLQRLERMERQLAQGVVAPAPPVPPAAAPVPPAADADSQRAATPVGAPTAAPAPADPSAQPTGRRPVRPEAVMPDPATPEPPRPGEYGGDLDAAAVRRVWGEIVALVNRSNKRIAALMRDAVVRDLTDGTLVVTLRSPVLAQMLSAQVELLADAIYEVLGNRLEISCEAAGDQRTSTPAKHGAPHPGSDPTAQQGRFAPTSGSTASRSRSALTGGRQASSRSGGSRPGGTGASSERRDKGASVPVSRPAAEPDWPETARPGGGAGSGDPAAPDEPSGAAGGVDRGNGWPTPARPGGGPEPTKPAPKPSAAATDGGTGEPPGTARAGVAVADSEWAGEPPYDPDYDGPVGGGVGYEGFDPGDEPLDEVVDERTAGQTSEQRAAQLLQQALDAQKIGEIEL